MAVHRPLKPKRCKRCKEVKKPKHFKNVLNRKYKYSRLCTKCQYKVPWARYSARNKALGKLGYPRYEDYLKSSLWRTIRGLVLDRDGRKCRICDEPANHVHHQRYNPATLVGKNLKFLVSLCGSCHKFNEFDDNGKKLDALEVRRRVDSAIRQADKARATDNYVWNEGEFNPDYLN